MQAHCGRSAMKIRCSSSQDRPHAGAARTAAQMGAQQQWRRCLGAAGAAATLVLSPLQGQSPAIAAGMAGVSPWDEGKRILLGPTADNRVRPCGINPNCLSSANLDELYGAPWRSPDNRPEAAAAVLEAAVAASVPRAELARSLALPDGALYRAWTVPSLFGDDVIEFVLRSDAPPTARTADGGSGGGGGGEGAAAGQRDAGVLVTYRSQAGSLKFIYPLQTPISDGGQQKKRLDALRQELGWPIEGCSYIECYQ